MVMGLSIYQLILAIVAISFIANRSLKFFRRESGQTPFKFLTATIIWGAIFSFSISPRLAHIVSEKLGLGENFNTLIFIGFVIVLSIIFKIMVIIEKIERNISEIVRKDAIEKFINSKDKSKNDLP